MAKAIDVHRVPTNWRIGGLTSFLEEIIGKVIGVSWLLGVERRVGKTTSSVVVYQDKEVFLGAEATRDPRAFVEAVVLRPIFLTPEVYRRVHRGAPDTGICAYLSFYLFFYWRFGVVYT